jgi:WD40 repeat protein
MLTVKVDAHDNRVNDLCFVGQSLVSVSDDPFVKVWDIATGALIRAWSTLSDKVMYQSLIHSPFKIPPMYIFPYQLNH